jgi:hypothetical protein
MPDSAGEFSYLIATSIFAPIILLIIRFCINITSASDGYPLCRLSQFGLANNSAQRLSL